MTLAAAILLGVVVALGLIWLVSTYLTPFYQKRSYIAVAVLTALYMMLVLKLLRT